MFWHYFNLNEMMRFVKKRCRFIHYIYIYIYKAQNDVVLNDIVYLLLPLTHKGRGRRFFFHSFAASISPSLPLPLPKNHDTTHMPSWPTTMMKEAEGKSTADGSRTATQRPPQPPYPCTMTGQG